MSHYLVAAITKDPNMIGEIMAPYCESDENYYEFVVMFSSLEEVHKAHEEYNKEHRGKKYFYDVEDDEEWALRYYNLVKEGEVYGSYYNPLSKWDWYQDGDGWVEESWFKNEIDDIQEYYKVKDYSVKVDDDMKKKAEDFWESYVEGKDPDKKDFFTQAYYTSHYGTKETYAKSSAIDCRPYAFIDPAGYWHEPGEMGWFAMDASNEDGHKTYVEEWLSIMNDPKYQDYYVVWIDCHI